MVLEPGRVVIVPGAQDGVIGHGIGGRKVLNVRLNPAASIHPNADVLFESALRVTDAAIAVILTGMGSDGAKGMQMLKGRGAHTLAEAEESCVVYGMPRAAFERGCVDQVAPLQDMAGIVKRHFGI